MVRILVVSSLFVVAACASPEAGGATSSDLSQGETNADAADHECRVVLRRAEVFAGALSGVVRANEAELAAGATAHVRFGEADTWQELDVAADGTFSAPHVGDAELVAYLAYPDGHRTFDHNVHSAMFDNTVLDATNAHLFDAGDACGSSSATIAFDADWKTEVRGVLAPGGAVHVRYDLTRLPGCFHSWYHGFPAWETLAFAKFGESAAPLQFPLKGAYDAATDSFATTPFDLTVPADAGALELWFLNSGETCSSSWDSSYGANYRFDVAR